MSSRESKNKLFPLYALRFISWVVWNVWSHIWTFNFDAHSTQCLLFAPISLNLPNDLFVYFRFQHSNTFGRRFCRFAFVCANPILLNDCFLSFFEFASILRVCIQKLSFLLHAFSVTGGFSMCGNAITFEVGIIII